MRSFDVFDTAIFRKVYKPRDIFYLIEKEVGNNFQQKRINAEQLAYKEDEFYSIETIYKYLPEFDMNKEIEYELKYCYANESILKIYNPNTDIFISDMYLHKSTIVKMLEKCGYKNPKVFVSTDIRARKSDGGAFKKVSNMIDSKIQIHYGDNYNSDVLGAKKLGIDTIFLPNLENKKLHLPVIKDPILKKYIAKTIDHQNGIIQYSALYAPIIIAFTKWVAQFQNNNTIYFCSRDMYLPYLFAKKYLHLKCKYLHVSRKSLSPLLIHSKYKKLNIKATQILSQKEYNERSKRDVDELISNFKYIKDGDVIVDIGYTGTVQLLLEEYLNINLLGLYMQTDKEMLVSNYKMYLNRFALIHQFLVEFMLSSPEDQLDDIINNELIYKNDNARRKGYSSIIVDEICYHFDELKDMSFDVFDIEQLLLFLQTNPNEEMLEIYNEPIMSNRTDGESPINCNKERIRKGELLDCYNHSYAQPLFKRILEQDRELAYLSKFLPE